MCLSMANIGVPNTIKRISGRDDTRRFLSSLGLIEGERITIISSLSGNLIVDIKNTRVALDKMLANRIMI